MKKIWIIDDSAFMRSVLKDLLTNAQGKKLADFEIVEMSGKKEALHLFTTETPDVILVDMVMHESETEGIEFLEEIKNSFDMNCVIIISSVGQESMLARAKKLGIIYYLQKPFDEKEIIDAVTHVFALREQTESE